MCGFRRFGVIWSELELILSEVDSIMSYNSELGANGFVWMHADYPSDLWVLGTDVIRRDVKNAVSGYPLSVDPTFNYGKFEVTPITYRSHMFEAMSKNSPGVWKEALFPGPVILHHFKRY